MVALWELKSEKIHFFRLTGGGRKVKFFAMMILAHQLHE
jgi:hypothetical protein